MYILIGVILFITMLGYILPKSKFVFVLEIVQIIVILGGYNGTQDLNFYLYEYNNGIVTEGYMEKLFDISATLFHQIGFSFEAFHMTLTIVSILIIAYVVYKISKQPALVMSMTVGFTMLEYAWQLKALCAAAIITYALYYYYTRIYLKGITVRRTICYIVLILLATGFHFVSNFFLLFLLISLINKERLKRIVFYSLIIISLGLTAILNFGAKYIGALNTYIGNIISLRTILGLYLLHLIGFAITLWIVSFIKKRKFYENTEEERYLDFVSRGSWILLIPIPFYSITSGGNRTMRIWSVFYYSLVSYFPKKNLKIFIPKIAMILYSIVSFIIFYVAFEDFSGNTYNLLIDILSNNIFWKL